jgi:hypothetical protein
VSALIRWATACALAIASCAAWGQTYYVSPSGSDGNDGLAPDRPWRSVGKVNASPFAPGAQILFQRGGEWRESLVASSSGEPGQPIVFGAYGQGAKPKFWGSDVLDSSNFQLLNGTASAYSLPMSKAINSVLADHQFFRQANLVTGNSSAQANIDYVKANPATWYYTAGKLYVNTGTGSPRIDGRTYTAAVREDVVYSNGQSHLVFENLVVDESARYGAGYAFRIDGGDDVEVRDSEAYRAGKHHFGAVNTTGFVGRNLYARQAMPDQGFGGASAYVSYSGPQRSGDTYRWEQITGEQAGGAYPVFVTHGPGVGELLIENVVSRDGGGGIFLDKENPSLKLVVRGAEIENGGVSVFGSDVLIDGLRLSGAAATVEFVGDRNILQNSVIVGSSPEARQGRDAAVIDSGRNNVIRFNTIALDPSASPYAAAVSVRRSDSQTQLLGNIFVDPRAVMLYQGAGDLDARDNLFASDPAFLLLDPATFALTYRTLAEWKAAGFDLTSFIGDPRFVDPAAGDLRLLAGSAAIDVIDPASALPLVDLRGVPRPRGDGYDLGAFEFSGGPEPDLNGDGRVDIEDFFLIDRGAALGLAGLRNGDANADGMVNADDYAIVDRVFLAQYARASGSAPSALAVPEPGLLVIVPLGGLLLARRRAVSASRLTAAGGLCVTLSPRSPHRRRGRCRPCLRGRGSVSSGRLRPARRDRRC